MSTSAKQTLGFGVVAVVVVLVVVAGFANAIGGMLVSVGFPSQVAGRLESALFFGTLLGLIVLAMKTVMK
jgi:hypothetical protein